MDNRVMFYTCQSYLKIALPQIKPSGFVLSSIGELRNFSDWMAPSSSQRRPRLFLARMAPRLGCMNIQSRTWHMFVPHN